MRMGQSQQQSTLTIAGKAIPAEFIADVGMMHITTSTMESSLWAIKVEVGSFKILGDQTGDKTVS